MKVLFLDIDGVLNNARTEDKIQTVFGPFTGLCPILTRRLVDWLTLHPDVKVVLSSSWRLDERYDHVFTKHLNSSNIFWIDITPNLGRRGREIASWLAKNDVERYAILDDISDMHPVGKALVQTSRHGLEDKHLRKLEHLLEV